MSKKIFITGATGLVGSRVKELLTDKYQFIETDGGRLDITDIEAVKAFFSKHQPEVVINFAAYTNVNEAENQTGDQQSPSWQVNVDGVNNLLQSLPQSSRLIHISTDMVFTGSQEDPGPYTEDHPLPESPDQLTWYGWTKNRGEQLVSDQGQTVVRIIYPVRASFDKPDYLRFPLRKYKEGSLYPLFKDQQVSLTFIDELAKALSVIIDQNHQGIFHVSSSNVGYPIDIIKYALEKLGQDTSQIKDSSITDYLATQKNKYRYHVKGGLDTQKTESKLGFKFSTWQQIIDQLIDQGLTLESA